MEKLIQRHRLVPGHCPAAQPPLSAAGSRPSRAAAAYVASANTDNRLPAAGDVTTTVDVNGGGVLIDESEEWAKIENIMASLDAGLSDCDVTSGVTVTSPSALQPISRLQPPTTAPSTDASEVPSQPVGLWLASYRLAHLEDILLSNGFDDVDFIGPGFLSDSDLIEMGVANSDDRRKLLAAASRLPSYATRTPCQFESMRSWLKALRLSEYTEAFQTHGFTTLDRLHNLWDVELTSVLRISRLGHRNRILAAIGSLPAPSVPPLGVKGQLDDDAWCTKSAKQSLNELSLYKDYTTLLNKRSKTSHSLTAGKELQTTTIAPPPPQQQQNHHKKQQPQLPLQHAVSSQSRSTADSLQIRPPQMSTDCEIKQWSHQPEVLMRGGCKYAALYVGSGAVDQLDDADATRRAIANIRQRSVAQSTGVTSATITISHTGVEFCHARTKELLGSHDIGNIFCACQDASLLDYFAFVTWQPTVGQHHCHVFCAENVKLAVEVVLTLGQAFEVAYQLAVLRSNVDTSATLPVERVSTAPRGGPQKYSIGSSNGTRTLPLDGRSVLAAGSHGVALHIY